MNIITVTLKSTFLGQSVKGLVTGLQKKWLVGLNVAAWISSYFSFRSQGLCEFNPFRSGALSKSQVLRRGSTPQTVPLSTEITLLPIFSFIWVKCISSSSPPKERQFDRGGKKKSESSSWVRSEKRGRFYMRIKDLD